MKICILGAGPTGLGAAHRLTEQGITDFKLFERADHVGGLAASHVDGSGFTWDFGVHVLHSHYDYVDRLLADVLPNGYYEHERRSWVRQHGKYIPYPFQYNIRYLPRAALWDCVDGLLDLLKNGQTETPENFAQFIMSTFGRGIAEHFMLPYNRKIWTVDPSEMSCAWLGERVPVTDVRRVLSNVIRQTDDVSWGPNHTFQFPREGGTGAIWRAMTERLPPDTLRLSHEAVGIDVEKKIVSFANGETASYEHLVSTMPLPELATISGQERLAGLAKRLRHTQTHVLGVAPSRHLPTELSDKTWVYCPSSKSSFYRLTPFSTFSPAHVPYTHPCCSVLCETAVPDDETPDEAALAQGALQGLQTGGFFDSGIESAHTFALLAKYGYPIPSRDRDELLADIQPALERNNIFSRGRFGGWKYEVANMDHCIMQGVEVIDRILSGSPESTLPDPFRVNAGKS